MKIFLQCSEYPPGPHGGIGTLTQLLARGLVRSGHQVKVGGIYPPEYPAADRETDEGVEVFRFREPPGRFSWVPARIRFFRRLSRWSAAGDIDLIEVPDYGAPAAGWPSLSVPVLARLSGSASFFAAEMGRKLKREFYLELASLRRADFWCSESEYMAAKTRALYKLRSPPSAIIYNPVDLPELTPESDRCRRRVVFAGTLTEKKGIIPLVQAWPRVHAACPDAELHMWGEDTLDAKRGSMQEFLLSQVPGEAASSIRFHGRVPLDELLKEFHTARLAVLPSFAEGFALMPLHAMAAACPTVYTARGSGPELIQNGVNGLLIDPARPDEIADAILRLLQDDDLAVRLGRAGREHVKENFSLDKIIERNEELYEDCLRRFHGRTSALAS